jgi:Sec-independent protein translocase protein TatA
MSPQSDAQKKPSLEELGRKIGKNLGEAKRNLEEESDTLIAYLNEEVVPAIRQGSSRALRTASEKLSQLAEFFEQDRSKSK